ncbi:MAG TPA: ribonuclease III [Steroidobacteraceae bacterium]|nr:ribonuclease III [Steroidobacteraceae bacterium]
MLSAVEWASRRLGHRFGDPALLDAALTHRSASRANYERLEFLGDAVLNFVIAELLFREYPEAEEGELSRYRAALVSSPCLAEVAAELVLGEQLRLGGGELKSGGFRRGSILADALEALFGAVYLDAGVEAASGLIERLFAKRLRDLPAAEALKDPKTRLQEALQGRSLPLPQYALEEVSGEAHEQWFAASCEVATLGLHSRGEGSSRRKAEQAAAERMLDELQHIQEGRA